MHFILGQFIHNSNQKTITPRKISPWQYLTVIFTYILLRLCVTEKALQLPYSSLSVFLDGLTKAFYVFCVDCYARGMGLVSE